MKRACRQKKLAIPYVHVKIQHVVLRKNIDFITVFKILANYGSYYMYNVFSH